MTKFETSGKGRKQCKSCGEYVAARALLCDCGAEFELVRKPPAVKPVTEKPKPKPQAPEPSRSHSANRIYVYTPAGRCPVKLDGNDADTIRKWVWELQTKADKQNRQYTVEAVCYFLREFYQYRSMDYLMAAGWVAETFADAGMETAQ